MRTRARITTTVRNITRTTITAMPSTLNRLQRVRCLAH